MRARHVCILVAVCVQIAITQYVYVLHLRHNSLVDRMWHDDGDVALPDMHSVPTVRNASVPGAKYAYATLLCDNEMAEATMVLVHSLRKTRTPHDVVVLTIHVSPEWKTQIIALGGKVVQVKKTVKYPFKISKQRWAINKPCRYSKLLVWGLTQYHKVIYIDSDMLVLRNIDILFHKPSLSATPDSLPPHRFNSGLMVLQPDNALLMHMLNSTSRLPSPNVGDQGFLNNYFSDWFNKGSAHCIDSSFNAFVRSSGTPQWSHFMEPSLKVLHYSGSTKPWNTKIDRMLPTTRKLDHLWWTIQRSAYRALETRRKDKMPALPRQHYVQLTPECEKNFMLYTRKRTPIDKLSVIITVIDSSPAHAVMSMVDRYLSLSIVHRVYLLLAGSHALEHWQMSRQQQEGVHIVHCQNCTVNDRLKPMAALATEAVFLCDSDVYVDSKAIQLAFQLWKTAPNRLVGFFPRSHYVGKGKRLYAIVDTDAHYSIVLSTALIMSADYMRMYSCQMSDSAREYVANTSQCQEAALNLLASKFSGMAPLYVRDVHKIGYGSFRSRLLSLDASLAECLNVMKQLLGYEALVRSLEVFEPFSHHYSQHVSPGASYPDETDSQDSAHVSPGQQLSGLWSWAMEGLSGSLRWCWLWLQRGSAVAAESNGGPAGNMSLLDEGSAVVHPLVSHRFAGRRWIHFMPQVNNSAEHEFGSMAEVPAGTCLCLLMSGVPSLDSQQFKLVNELEVHALEESAVTSIEGPTTVRHLSGTTFVVYAEDGFEDAAAVLRMAALFASWRVRHSCFSASTLVLFDRDGVVEQMTPWARLLVQAAMGHHILPQPFGPKSVDCYENSVVFRLRESPAVSMCTPWLLDHLQLAVLSECMGECSQWPAANGSHGKESFVEVFFMVGASRRKADSWLSFHSLSPILKFICTDRNLKCRITEQESGGSICRTQVCGLRAADIVIGTTEDYTTETMFLLSPNVTVVEVTQSISMADELKWIDLKGCLEFRRMKVSASKGVEGLLGVFQNEILIHANAAGFTKKGKRERHRCLDSVVAL